MKLHRLALATAALALASAAGAATLPTPARKPLPAPDATPRYDSAPEPWRDFLAKASAASAIADPLKRCLAFPDVPGNQWPANLAAQHCDYELGPVPSLEEVRKRLDANDVAGLEQLYKELQALHESHQSERIHVAFGLFDSSYDSGALSKRWLDAAPNSPYALTARAQYFRKLGWAARGADFAAKTPKEQFEQMHAQLQRAAELYRQALAIEPKLMHAHMGLIDIATAGEMNEAAVFKAAQAADAGCVEINDTHMRALEPRWGGSYDQMLALAHQLLPLQEQRPLLAISRSVPYVDLQDVYYRAEKYPEAAAALEPVAPMTSNPEVYEDLATTWRHMDDVDQWKILAYYVAATRFRPGDAFAARERGRLQMLLANDIPAAASSLEYSIRQEPGDYFSHYLYGAALGRLDRFDEAEREYLLAMQDKPDAGTHKDGLLELASLMFRAQRADKAQKYGRQAIAEYPDSARAWYVHAWAQSLTPHDAVDLRRNWETAIAKVDPGNKQEAYVLSGARKQLDDLKAAVLKAGGKW